jgi:flagellar basal-body rod protein FlgB
MSSTLPALMNGIGREMKHLAERQRVLAQNIANSETPGYKSREVQ